MLNVVKPQRQESIYLQTLLHCLYSHIMLHEYFTLVDWNGAISFFFLLFCVCVERTQNRWIWEFGHVNKWFTGVVWLTGCASKTWNVQWHFWFRLYDMLLLMLLQEILDLNSLTTMWACLWRLMPATAGDRWASAPQSLTDRLSTDTFVMTAAARTVVMTS